MQGPDKAKELAGKGPPPDSDPLMRACCADIVCASSSQARPNLHVGYRLICSQ